MTIFTIDTDPEQKFLKSDNVSKVCLERLKDLIKDTDIEFKIFTPKDEIVDECLKKYSNYTKYIKGEVPVGYEPFLADLIRIYILSKNKNYLYIDSDIYFKNLDILKYLKEEPKAFFPYSFCGLWSGEHPETFQVVLDRFYKDVNDNGYQYIIKNHGKINDNDYLSDGCAWIYSKFNLGALGWNQLEECGSFLHFDSGKFSKDNKYKHFICSEQAKQEIIKRPDTWQELMENNIKIIVDNFPWFEWSESHIKNTFISLHVLNYGQVFTLKEFLEVLRKLFPAIQIV